MKAGKKFYIVVCALQRGLQVERATEGSSDDVMQQVEFGKDHERAKVERVA
jgi:hypothetical protein